MIWITVIGFLFVVFILAVVLIQLQDLYEMVFDLRHPKMADVDGEGYLLKEKKVKKNGK